MVDPRLVAGIDRLPATPFDGIAFRQQPLQYPPLSGRGARILGGRWNPPDSFSVLYLGLSQATVVAELERQARVQQVDLADFLPRAFFRYDISADDLLDLRDTRAREAVGLGPADLVGESRSVCQAVGEAAQHAGREGLIAPSATGEGTVLALFLDTLRPESSVVPQRLELWEVPTDPKP